MPLLVKLPGSSRVADVHVPVSTDCLLPTLLELCGIDYDPAEMTGTSLVPLLRGEPGFNAARPTFSTGVENGDDREAVIFEGWKYLRAPDSDYEELYDLGEDPLERRNVAALHPEQAARGRELIEAHRAHAAVLRADGGGAGAARELDTKTQDLLRSLGYL